jgi:hypothetical protein
VHLVLHAGRVDHQAGVVADDDAAHVHVAGGLVDLDIDNPRRPRGAEAGELAVHVARVGEALAFEQVTLRGLLLRSCVCEPTRARGRRCNEFRGALILQMQ